MISDMITDKEKYVNNLVFTCTYVILSVNNDKTMFALMNNSKEIPRHTIIFLLFSLKNEPSIFYLQNEITK